MRTAGRNLWTGWRLIAVACFVTFSGNLFFLGNSVEASGSNRPNPHKVRRAPTAQVDDGDNTASPSPGNTSENVTGTPSTVAGNSVNNASGNGVGNFTASPTQSSLTRNISSVVLGNPVRNAAGMSPTLENRDSSGIIARNVSGGTPNFLRILENAGLKDAPGNIPRNVSDTEEWWASSILFPKVWESVVDAGVEWTKYNASLDCSTALREYAASLLKKEAWAVRIYDSTGKEGAGMVVGGLTQHGNYDECLNARHYHELEPPHVTQFHKTQYCSAFFDTPAWMAQFVKTLEVPYPVKLPIMTVDLCVPATCTERDIHTIISTYLQNRNHNITTKNVECFHHADITHDPAALIVIAIFSVILLLVMLGTCLDVLSRLQSIEVVTGETTHVGMERRHSRLSRFRHSLVHHFHHIIGTESSGPTQYRPMQRRATIGGYKPSIMRRVSNSLIKRRPSHADADATSGGGVTDTRSEGGGEQNSGIVASDHGSPVAPPRYSKKHAFHLGHYRKTKEHNGLMRHRSDTYLIHPETGGSDNTLISAAHKSDTNRFKFGPQRSVSLPEGHTGSFRTDDASEVTEMADNRVNISSTAATSDTNLNGNEGEAPNRCADKPQVQNEKLQSLADAGSRSTESTDRTTVEGRDSHRTDAFAKYLAETGTEHKVDGIEDGKNIDAENCALQENNESTIKDNTKQDSTSTNTNAGNASSVGNEDSGIETESAPQESTAEAVDELGNRTESLGSGKKTLLIKS